MTRRSWYVWAALHAHTRARTHARAHGFLCALRSFRKIYVHVCVSVCVCVCVCVHAGGRPLSPRSKKKLNIQYYHWTDMGVGKVVKV